MGGVRCDDDGAVHALCGRGDRRQISERKRSPEPPPSHVVVFSCGGPSNTRRRPAAAAAACFCVHNPGPFVAKVRRLLFGPEPTQQCGTTQAGGAARDWGTGSHPQTGELGYQSHSGETEKSTLYFRKLIATDTPLHIRNHAEPHASAVKTHRYRAVRPHSQISSDLRSLKRRLLGLRRGGRGGLGGGGLCGLVGAW
jgi:hypothetical protein